MHRTRVVVKKGSSQENKTQRAELRGPDRLPENESYAGLLAEFGLESQELFEVIRSDTQALTEFSKTGPASKEAVTRTVAKIQERTQQRQIEAAKAELSSKIQDRINFLHRQLSA